MSNNAAAPWAACRELLIDYPVIIDTLVAWGEMDAFQHVNNVVYFRYFESARIAYFDRIGYTSLAKDSGLGPILAETSCRFRSALTYPDHISVGARVANIESDQFMMEYAVASAGSARVAATGNGLVVSYDYAGRRRVPLPKNISEAIASLESAD